jgi:Tfp pilus assembly protein PilO
MEYVVWAIGGLLVGAVLAWLVATKHAQSELADKLGEAEHRSATLECRATAAEATATELRRQYEEMRRKVDDELQQLTGHE